MFIFEHEIELVQDREDLITIIQMRFGECPYEVITKIYDICDFHQLQRLILVAANVDSFQTFLEELEESEQAYRLVGERFQPFSEKRGG